MNSPDRLGVGYERRAKLAALTSVGLLAVGAAKVDIVPAADAAIERSDAQEAKSPSAVIADINSRVIKMAQRIKSEPNVKKYSWEDVTTDRNMLTYFVTVKNAKNPSNYDGLMISVDKKNGSPTELQYLSDFTKGQRLVPKGSKSRLYSINHRTFNGYNPNVIELDIYTGNPEPIETYRVGQKRENIPGSDYAVPGYVEYQDKPALVTQRINYVFQQADNFLRINK